MSVDKIYSPSTGHELIRVEDKIWRCREDWYFVIEGSDVYGPYETRLEAEIQEKHFNRYGRIRGH